MSSLEANSRIAIIRLSSFGDVLLSTPMIRSLRAALPDSHLTMISRHPFSSMIEHHPDLSEVMIYSEHLEFPDPFDLVIDLQHNFRSKRLLKRMTYTQKVTYQKQQLSRFFYVNMKIGSFNTPIRSVVERYHDTIQEFEIPLISERPDYHIHGQYQRPTNDPYIVIAPGAAHVTKQWPESNYLQLIERMKLTYSNHRIVLLGGPAEISTSDHLKSRHPELINKTGHTSFDESAFIIKHANLVICNDSSMMHMANAMDRPIVVFFGSTTERFGFFPYGAKYEVLQQNELRCRPCSHIGRSACPEGHFRCMLDLTSDRAMQAVERLLGDSA